MTGCVLAGSCRGRLKKPGVLELPDGRVYWLFKLLPVRTGMSRPGSVICWFDGAARQQFRPISHHLNVGDSQAG